MISKREFVWFTRTVDSEKVNVDPHDVAQVIELPNCSHVHMYSNAPSVLVQEPASEVFEVCGIIVKDNPERNLLP